jgi:chromosome segregation ATPase
LLVDRLRLWFGILPARRASPPLRSGPLDEDPQQLRARCRELEGRIEKLGNELNSRSEQLYALQQHYSSEHFRLAESMRNLRTEEMRSAGARAQSDVVLQRYRNLQDRIALLKARLRRHEEVEDAYFDAAPLVVKLPEER